jgi:hypothetical protein
MKPKHSSGGGKITKKGGRSMPPTKQQVGKKVPGSRSPKRKGY